MYGDYGYYGGYGYNNYSFGGIDDKISFSIFILIGLWIIGKIALKTANYDLEKGCELERNTVGVLDPMSDLSFQQCKLTATKSIKTWTFINKIVPYLLLGCIILFIVKKYHII